MNSTEREKVKGLLMFAGKVAIIAGLSAVAWHIYVKDFKQDPLTEEQKWGVEFLETWKKAV